MYYVTREEEGKNVERRGTDNATVRVYLEGNEKVDEEGSRVYVERRRCISYLHLQYVQF